MDASTRTIRVTEQKTRNDSPAIEVVIGEATLQEAREVGQQIEQRVQQAIEELPQAG